MNVSLSVNAQWLLVREESCLTPIGQNGNRGETVLLRAEPVLLTSLSDSPVFQLAQVIEDRGQSKLGTQWESGPVCIPNKGCVWASLGLWLAEHHTTGAPSAQTEGARIEPTAETNS